MVPDIRHRIPVRTAPLRRHRSEWSLISPEMESQHQETLPDDRCRWLSQFLHALRPEFSATEHVGNLLLRELCRPYHEDREADLERQRSICGSRPSSGGSFYEEPADCTREWRLDKLPPANVRSDTRCVHVSMEQHCYVSGYPFKERSGMDLP